MKQVTSLTEPRNYTPAELEAYLRWQSTGDNHVRPTFRQKVSETNFTIEDRKKVQEARRTRRKEARRARSEAGCWLSPDW